MNQSVNEHRHLSSSYTLFFKKIEGRGSPPPGKVNYFRLSSIGIFGLVSHYFAFLQLIELVPERTWKLV